MRVTAHDMAVYFAKQFVPTAEFLVEQNFRGELLITATPQTRLLKAAPTESAFPFTDSDKEFLKKMRITVDAVK